MSKDYIFDSQLDAYRPVKTPKAVSHLVTFAIGAVAAFGAMFLAVPEASAEEVWVMMPTCQYEDGNPDGKPCLWIHPRTGVGYVNDGHNYRD